MSLVVFVVLFESVGRCLNVVFAALVFVGGVDVSDILWVHGVKCWYIPE